MAKLEELARDVKSAFGLLHKANLEMLRHYINTTDEDEIEAQIRDLKEPNLLRTLWEAGLNSRLQKVVLSELEKYKQGG